MGREIQRVPLDFIFPLDESYADVAYEQHCAKCTKPDGEDHDDCDWSMSPPKGEGWQLWQTVSDGPVTPVFATSEALIEYMSQPVPPEDWDEKWDGPYTDGFPKMPRGRGWRRETAEKFVRSVGWMPTMVISAGHVQSTAETVAFMSKAKGAP